VHFDARTVATSHGRPPPGADPELDPDDGPDDDPDDVLPLEDVEPEPPLDEPEPDEAEPDDEPLLPPLLEVPFEGMSEGAPPGVHVPRLP
jgi:hypothetical protein